MQKSNEYEALFTDIFGTVYFSVGIGVLYCGFCIHNIKVQTYSLCFVKENSIL